jgi:PIN domain nuclease of toxin-antitoxin system
MVSAVSAFELTQKVVRGRIRLPGSIAEAIDAFSFGSLPVTVAHAELAARLPRHHRDPFDRLLIAQAQIESLTIVTGDEAFQAYDVQVVHC